MLLAYAVVPSGTALAPAGLPGLALLESGLVGLVYEERTEPPGTSREELVRFGQVIRRLGADAAILPIRYGTVAESLDDLRILLTARRQAWEERLRDVAGCVELVAHLPASRLDPAPAAEARSTGTAYLMARVRRGRQVTALVEEVRQAVSAWSLGTRLLSDADDVRVAFLVEKERVDAFLPGLRQWVERSGQGRVRVSGPWPPFSFVEEES